MLARLSSRVQTPAVAPLGVCAFAVVVVRRDSFLLVFLCCTLLDRSECESKSWCQYCQSAGVCKKIHCPSHTRSGHTSHHFNLMFFGSKVAYLKKRDAAAAPADEDDEDEVLCDNEYVQCAASRGRCFGAASAHCARDGTRLCAMFIPPPPLPNVAEPEWRVAAVACSGQGPGLSER